MKKLLVFIPAILPVVLLLNSFVLKEKEAKKKLLKKGKSLGVANIIFRSTDGGKTWNAIGEDLQPSRISLLMKRIGLLQSSSGILSIRQMGKYLLCGRADGMFRSADMGKTWQQLSLSSTENFGFNVSVSGNVIYVMPNKGC